MSIGARSSLVLLAALAGCSYSPGGAGYSNDTFTYVSTAHLPATISVLDTRSGEQVLNVDVPVGQQLVLKFQGHSTEERNGSAELRWGLMPAGAGYGGLTNTVTVPPSSARRVAVAYRRAPEYTRPLAQAKPAEVPTGVTIAGAPKPAQPVQQPNTEPTPEPASRPAPAEAPKVDLPE